MTASQGSNPGLQKKKKKEKKKENPFAVPPLKNSGMVPACDNSTVLPGVVALAAS